MSPTQSFADFDISAFGITAFHFELLTISDRQTDGYTNRQTDNNRQIGRVTEDASSKNRFFLADVSHIFPLTPSSFQIFAEASTVPSTSWRKPPTGPVPLLCFVPWPRISRIG